MKRDTKQAPAAARRARRVPPPLTSGGGEAFTGSVALVEGDDDALGGLLWTSLRGVLLWAEAAPEDRPALFLPSAEAERMAWLRLDGGETAPREPLAELARMVGSPGAAETGAVADACRRIAEWAESEGRLKTALGYLQAAALVCQDDAAAAYATGRMARRVAEYARAESWFQETIERAGRNSDYTSSALAYVGIGNLHVQRGNFPVARSAHRRALALARKHHLPAVEGMAHHDLFAVALIGEQFAAAEKHAAAALRAYGPGHRRLVSLAHDLALVWLDRGAPARSLVVLRAVLPHVRQRRERMLTLGSVARAAGRVGDRATFEEARAEIQEVAGTDLVPEGTAPALVALAQGADGLGDRALAVDAAEQALELARRRGEAHTEHQAEEQLAALRSVLPGPSQEDPPEDRVGGRRRGSGDALARAFVSALEEVPVPA